jgi:NADPH:quinone reductase-like Zn-dependent oxidoreductase
MDRRGRATLIGAVMQAAGAKPQLAEFREPATVGAGQAIVEVLAAGLNPVDRHRAGEGPLPRVLGNEGVGVLAGQGRDRVYFERTVAPFGSIAQRALIDPAIAVPLPDDVTSGAALAIGIAGLAGWLSLTLRARLQAGERVLVLGASGAVGRIAVQGARLLGAGRVVAAGRSLDTLEPLRALGADALVELSGDYEQALKAESDGGFDVVVDPLFGEPLLAALTATADGARIVSLGSSASATATLTRTALMGRTLIGHGNRSTPVKAKREAYLEMLAHLRAGELAVVFEELPLERFQDAWRRQAESPHTKLVLVP